MTTVHDKARAIIEEHGTRDIGRICRDRGIALLYLPLGRVRGMSNVIGGRPVIIINNRLDDFQQTVTGYHELGHVVLSHTEQSRITLSTSRIAWSLSRPLEFDADVFASHFYLPDEYILDRLEEDFSWYDITAGFGLYDSLSIARLNDFEARYSERLCELARRWNDDPDS
ncbi:MAG: ImmA/IrrE family metallo-endopeptidase [Clostridiaceae bacterium]|nr:ImmA/IrrE family metallo-endopeptidase [Clostridiaceae bacterium]